MNRYMTRLSLPNVTLCAASDVAIGATLSAMKRCLQHASFHEALFFSSANSAQSVHNPIRHVPVPPLDSKEAYSRFILADLAQYIQTDFVLIVQWDGFIVDPTAWDPCFLDFDYIGAPWTNFAPPRNVGNGGFSLRSRRLLEAGMEPWFDITHPEDLCICQVNRDALLARNFRIADAETARRFSREREPAYDGHFGVHGVFTLAEVMSEKEFELFMQDVEFGVIGPKELLDVIDILNTKNPLMQALDRCYRESALRSPHQNSNFKKILNKYFNKLSGI